MTRMMHKRIIETKSAIQGSLDAPLSKREKEILRHLATGSTIASVAETCNISMNTMKTHVKNIYRKLGVDTKKGAVEKAQNLFLI